MRNATRVWHRSTQSKEPCKLCIGVSVRPEVLQAGPLQLLKQWTGSNWRTKASPALQGLCRYMNLVYMLIADHLNSHFLNYLQPQKLGQRATSTTNFTAPLCLNQNLGERS